MKGIPVVIDNCEFSSARAGAVYIVAAEEKLGNGRKVNTVAKELQKSYIHRGAHEWRMYGRYHIKPIRHVTAGDED